MIVSAIVIAGAGGLGREILQYVQDIFDPKSYQVKGFLDDKCTEVTAASFGHSILGRCDDYALQPDDLVVVAVGDPKKRLNLARRLEQRGAKFLTIVHPLAYVSPSAQIGVGCIVGPFATVGACAEVGSHVALTYYSSIGHDAQIGSGCTFSPYSAANGGAVLDECVFLGTHAVVNPLKRLGRAVKVAAGSVVYHDVPPDTLVAGNPAKPVPQIRDLNR